MARRPRIGRLALGTWVGLFPDLACNVLVGLGRVRLREGLGWLARGLDGSPGQCVWHGCCQSMFFFLHSDQRVHARLSSLTKSVQSM